MWRFPQKSRSSESFIIISAKQNVMFFISLFSACFDKWPQSLKNQPTLHMSYCSCTCRGALPHTFQGISAEVLARLDLTRPHGSRIIWRILHYLNNCSFCLLLTTKPCIDWNKMLLRVCRRHSLISLDKCMSLNVKKELISPKIVALVCTFPVFVCFQTILPSREQKLFETAKRIKPIIVCIFRSVTASSIFWSTYMCWSTRTTSTTT